MSDRPIPLHQLQRALELVAYEMECRPEAYRSADVIEALEQLRAAAALLPPAGRPLHESYPAVVALAVRALAVLGSVPDPGEVDGLTDFAGFDLWRQQRGS